MHVLSDAGAFFLHGMLLLETFEPSLHLFPKGIMSGSSYQPNCSQSRQSHEPFRLPEMRRQNKANARSVLVPDAMVVAADDTKCVGARVNIVIVSNAARSSIDPIGIDSIEFVFETIFLGHGETQSGVVKLQFTSPR